MENNQNNQLFQTPSNTLPKDPPLAQAVQKPQAPTKKRFDLRIVFILLILIGLGGGAAVGLREMPTENPLPTPTDIPTPTTGLIEKPKNAIATDSAFLELVGTVASLSSHINAMQISDSTLLPPTIELSLGFQK